MVSTISALPYTSEFGAALSHRPPPRNYGPLPQSGSVPAQGAYTWSGAYHVVRVVDELGLPLALVVGVGDHRWLPFPTAVVLTGWVGW